MKQHVDWLPLLRVIVSALIGAGLLSSCASATIEDAVPTAAPPAQGVSEPVETALSSGGPKDTGAYPNLNIKPQAANQQLTPKQTASEMAALKAAQTQQAATGADAGTTDPELLRKLAATHAEEALKAIEAQQ